MIFVTVGSQKFQFNRLLEAVDQLVADGTITEDVFVQSGASDYIPIHCISKKFIDREEFAKKMEQCDLVITHGGTGTIVGAIKDGKKVIAVPRLKKYGEHVDDHQVELINQFVKSNFISGCEELNRLGVIIKETREKIFNKYKSNTQEYIDIIDDYIKSL